ncbi:MAG: hypothetical protein ACI4U9_02215 [Clostridia bacterium]
MKKSKKNYAIIALVVVLLALAIGYAAFSANLTIDGTATGGKWDVKFTAAAINEANHGTANFTDDTVTVNATLGFPGDGCTVTATITNNGGVPAKLTAFKLYAEDGTSEYSNADIDVTIPTIATDGTETLAAGESCPVTIAIKWKDSSTTETGVSAKFKVKFTYAQDGASVTVNPDHGAHTSN